MGCGAGAVKAQRDHLDIRLFYFSARLLCYQCAVGGETYSQAFFRAIFRNIKKHPCAEAALRRRAPLRDLHRRRCRRVFSAPLPWKSQDVHQPCVQKKSGSVCIASCIFALSPMQSISAQNPLTYPRFSVNFQSICGAGTLPKRLSFDRLHPRGLRAFVARSFPVNYRITFGQVVNPDVFQGVFVEINISIIRSADETV